MAGINVALRQVCGTVAAVFLLSATGCATSNMGGFNMASYLSGNAKPKSIVVGEFDVAPGTMTAEQSLAPAYRRKLGKVTPDQLKGELATAIDEAFTEAMVAALTEGGLPATVASPEATNSGETIVIVTGRVRKFDDKDRMRRKLSGLPPARTTVIADVQVNQQFGETKKELLTFAGDGELAGKPNTSSANTTATTASTGLSEKLTASAAAEARRAGRASAGRILAYAAEQGWVASASATAANADSEVRVSGPPPPRATHR
jgi:hypothetical protein